MYLCAGVLLFVSPSSIHDTSTFDSSSPQSYLVGLWFSLRTHASQIWQNPQQLLHPHESGRMSLYNKIVPPSNLIPGVSKPGPQDSNSNTVRLKPSSATTDAVGPSSHGAATTQSVDVSAEHSGGASSSTQSALGRTFPPHPPASPTPGSLVPIMESVDHALKDTGLQPGQLPPDDFTRAVAVATVSALRHQQVQARRVRSGQLGAEEEDPAGHAGHDGPSWSRAVSASVLLACTALYAIIAGTYIQNALLSFLRN